MSVDLYEAMRRRENRRIKTLAQPRAFRTWLYRIAHNNAVSALRKAGREVSWETAEADGSINGVGATDDLKEFDASDAAVVLALQQVQMIAHDPQHQPIVDPAHAALDQQALGEAARRYPHRIQLLNAGQHARGQLH